MSMSPILMLIIYNVHNLYIMYKAQDYTVILFFRTTANPVMWKTFSWLHHFTMREVLGLHSWLKAATLYWWGGCTKPVNLVSIVHNYVLVRLLSPFLWFWNCSNSMVVLIFHFIMGMMGFFPFFSLSLSLSYCIVMHKFQTQNHKNIWFLLLCTFIRVYNYINSTGGAGTTYPSGAPEFTPLFSEVCVDQSFVFCLVVCRSLFVLFLMAIMLSVLLRLADSDYAFGIFKSISHGKINKVINNQCP